MEGIKIRDLRKKEKFFIDDLYLNGYAKKCGIYATGVYLSLCRYANKEQKCFPSLKKIALELAISEKQVSRSIRVLEGLNLIKKERLGKKLTNRYYLLDKSEWTDSPFSDRTTSLIIGDYQSDHQGTDSPIHSKVTHIKDTQEKGSATPVVADNLNPLIDLFREVNPSWQRLFGNNTEREALARLVKQHGEEKTKQMISGLKQIFGKPYAPTIATPYQLEKKLADYIAYIQKQKSSQRVFKIN